MPNSEKERVPLLELSHYTPSPMSVTGMVKFLKTGGIRLDSRANESELCSHINSSNLWINNNNKTDLPWLIVCLNFNPPYQTKMHVSLVEYAIKMVNFLGLNCADTIKIMKGPCSDTVRHFHLAHS